MADDFDFAVASTLASQPAEQPAGTVDDDYAVKSSLGLPIPADGQSMRASMVPAITANPETETELRKVAKRTGVPIDTVRSYPEEMKRKAALSEIDFDGYAQMFPASAAILSDPDLAKISHDDRDNMGGIERSIKALGAGAVLGTLGLVENVLRAPETIDRMGQAARQLSEGAPQPHKDSVVVAGMNYLADQVKGGSQYLTENVGAFKRLSQKGQQADTATSDALKGNFAAIGDIVTDPEAITGFIGQAVPSLAAAIATGGGLPAIGALEALAASSDAIDFEKKSGIKMDPVDFTKAVAQAGVLNAMLEKIGLNKVLSPKRSVGAALGAAATEGATESLQQVNSNLAAQLNYDPNKKLSEGVLASALGGAGTGGAVQGARSLAEGAATRLEQQQQKAQAADQNAQALDQLDQLARESKLRQRSPDDFKQFIEDATKDGTVSDVYVSATQLAQSPETLQALAAASPTAAAQVVEAVATGSDIRIPVAEYATSIAGTDLHQNISDYLKTSPDGMSRIEAQEFTQAQSQLISDEVQKVLSATQEQETLATSRDTVYTNLLKQLTDTKRFSPDVNKSYASMMANFFTVYGERSGQTAEELYQKFPLQIKSAFPKAPRKGVMNQIKEAIGLGTKPTNTPEFKQWFGDSKVVDAKSEPLVVYRADSIDFDKFDKRKAKEGFFFHSSEAQAKLYGENVRAFYLSIKNPLIVERALPNEKNANDIKGTNFDGVINEVTNGKEFIVVDPTQIKSVNNKGAFDPNDPRILNQKDKLGAYDVEDRIITLFKSANLSTFLHESGHFFLETLNTMAQDETIAPQIKEDLGTALSWMGVEGNTPAERIATWNSWDLEQQRYYHEKFARGFEAYLFEGKSPSVKMQNVFQRFRAWLLNIYRSAENLNVELNDEIRGVFDRMLATNAQIEEAQAVRNFDPLFKTEADSGMSPEQFAEYAKQGGQATQDAIRELESRTLRNMKWLSNAKAGVLKALQNEADAKRKAIRDEVTQEVLSEPINQAKYFIRRGIIWGTGEEAGGAHRLDVDALKQMYGDGKPKRYTDPALQRMLRDLRNPKRVKDGRVSLLDFIAAAGGIKDASGELKALGADKWHREKGGRRKLIAAEGTAKNNADTMREAAVEQGYLPVDSTPNDLYDLIDRELRGDRVFKQGEEYTEYDGYMQALEGLQQDLDESGIDLNSTSDADIIKSYNKNSAEENVAEPLWKQLESKYGKYGMLGKDGIHPDIVADIFGFRSGDQLVRALLNAEPAAQKIKGQTDQRMLERYGELVDPAELNRAADEAIHNEVRTKFISAELDALAKATGQGRIAHAAYKQAAESMIARTPVKSIKPNQYAMAEARAAKASAAAWKKGDVVEAALQKRNQLINNYATRAAYDALKEVDRANTLFKKIASANKDTSSTRNMDLVNAAKGVLSNYGVGMRGQDPKAYLDTVKEYDPELYEALAPMLQNAANAAQDWRTLPMEDLRAIYDTVNSLWYLSRRQRQIEIDNKMLSREFVVGELTDRLAVLGADSLGVPRGRAATEKERNMRYILGALASVRRPESWVDAVDGGKVDGPFRSYMFNPIKNAANNYRVDAGIYLKKYKQLIDSIAPTLTPGRIDAPEINYTFGYSKGDMGKAELLHALLHTGNGSNKRKLLLGRQWATENTDGTLNTERWDAFRERMFKEGKITKADMDFVQNVWGLMEEIKPLAQRAHREVFGRYFDEITAEPVQTPWGEYAGGYVPAIVDSFEANDAKTRENLEAVNQGNAYMMPSTSKGFTKSRTEYNKPLLLDLRLLSSHIDKAILFSHMEPRVKDVMRVLRDKDLTNMISSYDPVAYNDMLIPWLNRAAKQIVETPSTGDGGRLVDNIARVARKRAGMAAMFGNVVNAAQQFTGLSITASKVNAGHLREALVLYLKDPWATAQQVSELSPFMATRMVNEIANMRGGIDDVLLNPNAYQKVKDWGERNTYFLQSATQNIVDTISWMGAYNQALAKGLDDRLAIREADAVIRLTQGSTAPEDISKFESGTAFVRLFTQFQGYFNMQANLLFTENAKAKRGEGSLSVTKLALLAFVIPAYVSEVIKLAAMGGFPDDDKDGYLDDFLAFLFLTPVKGATAMVPGVGQAFTASINAFNNKTYDDRLAQSPAVSSFEGTARAPASIVKATTGQASAAPAVKDTLTLITTTTGLPAVLLSRPAGYLTKVAEGRVAPTDPVDFARGVVTGQPSPGSKR